MSSKYIIAKADKFAQSLIGLEKGKQIEACRNEVKSLKLDYKITTVRKNLTQYREATKALGLSLNRYLRILKAEQKSIEKTHRTKKYFENKNRIKIDNFEGMINKAIELLNSEKPSDIAVGLCLLLGRRPSEIMKTVKLYNYGRRADRLFYTGQLKSRGIDKGKLPLYALGKSAKVCKVALKKLRSLADTEKMTLKQVDRRYLNQLLRRAKFHFSGYINNCSTYDLRKAYACISAHLYHNDNDQLTRRVFISNLMGHNEGDTDTAKSYDKYYI